MSICTPHLKILLTLGAGLLLALAPGPVRAHCDRVNGPVAQAARQALSSGEYETIAIWVSEEQAPELEERFQQALPVYNQGGQARELAERYFMETAVRLHREAEGMPYTGLKPAQAPAPDIAAAEKALQTGDLTPVLDLLGAELEQQTAAWFRQARQARRAYEGAEVAAGREWVDAYVKYIIYVHGLHQAIQAGPEHGVGE